MSQKILCDRLAEFPLSENWCTPAIRQMGNVAHFKENKRMNYNLEMTSVSAECSKQCTLPYAIVNAYSEMNI